MHGGGWPYVIGVVLVVMLGAIIRSGLTIAAKTKTRKDDRFFHRANRWFLWAIKWGARFNSFLKELRRKHRRKK